MQVLNSGPSRSVDTVVDITLPKILTPSRHRLLQVVDWQVRPATPTAAAQAAVAEVEVAQSVLKQFEVHLCSVASFLRAHFNC